jgi:hypothetical protein
MEQQRTHVLDWLTRMDNYPYDGQPIDTYRAGREAFLMGSRADKWRNTERQSKTEAPATKRKRRVQVYPAEVVQRVREMFGRGSTYKSVSAELDIAESTLQKMRNHLSPYAD